MMESMLSEDVFPRKDLIYRIDREFVQARALFLFGREFSDEEIDQTTKYIEWGLSTAVFDVIDIALKETRTDNLK